MLMSLWNWLVWLATVDFMWISAGVSVLLIFGVWALRNNKDINFRIISGVLGFCDLFVFIGVLISSYDEELAAVPSGFPHFLLWHLVALGVVVAGTVGWFSIKGLKKLWTYWQNKRNALEEICGTKIRENLEARRRELEKLMDSSNVSETIRTQVNDLLDRPIKHLLSMRQFILEYKVTLDAIKEHALNNTSISAESRKEITNRHEHIEKKLADINSCLDNISTIVDILIIQMCGMNVGLEHGAENVRRAVNDLYEIVSVVDLNIDRMRDFADIEARFLSFPE